MGSPAHAFHMHARKEPIRCIQYDKKQLVLVVNQAKLLKMAAQLSISEQQFKVLSQFWEYLEHQKRWKKINLQLDQVSGFQAQPKPHNKRKATNLLKPRQCFR